MKNKNSKELLSDLKEDTLFIIQQVETQLRPLSEEALNYKPFPKQWSVLECIAHLNIADLHYYSEIKSKLNSGKTTPKESYSGGALGSYFTKMMKPKENNTIPSKMKTVGKFFPDISLQGQEETSIIDTFLEDQQSLLNLLEQANEVNLEKLKIKSALGGWLMFKLGDAFRFVIAHNQRHVLQAMNVLKEYKSSKREV